MEQPTTSASTLLPKTETLTETEEQQVEKDFVVVKPFDDFKCGPHGPSVFLQMENYLKLQRDKCQYYKEVFEAQNNASMVSKFDAVIAATGKDLDILRHGWQNDAVLPKFKFHTIDFSCMPCNIDVEDKQLRITVKVSDMTSTDENLIYVIAEFDFPVAKDETLRAYLSRWYRYVKIDNRYLLRCESVGSKQLDSARAVKFVPFYDLGSNWLEFERPLVFYVEKGKSRSLKRKFKPIRLTFYEKTRFLEMDKKIGTLQFKIDGINDEVNLIYKDLAIMDGRRPLQSHANVQVSVREPLVEKTIRAHSEKILTLV